MLLLQYSSTLTSIKSTINLAALAELAEFKAEQKWHYSSRINNSSWRYTIIIIANKSTLAVRQQMIFLSVHYSFGVVYKVHYTA